MKLYMSKDLNKYCMYTYTVVLNNINFEYIRSGLQYSMYSIYCTITNYNTKKNFLQTIQYI